MIFLDNFILPKVKTLFVSTMNYFGLKEYKILLTLDSEAKNFRISIHGYEI